MSYPYHPSPPPRRSSKTAWIVVAILAVVGVIGLAIFAAVVSRSRSEKFDSNSITSARLGPSTSKFGCPKTAIPPDPGVDPDCYFVFMMTKRAGIPSSSGVPMSLIADAHEACAVMDQAAATGADPPSLAGLALIRRKHPELSVSDAAYFGGIAMAAYCPWDVRK